MADLSLEGRRRMNLHFSRISILICFLASMLSACASSRGAASFERDAAEIMAVLNQQVAHWNAGDIDGYMRGYWNSPDLRFASGGEVQLGWRPTLERYRARYPDRAAMGRLAFSDLDVRLLNETTALVFGRWRLERANDSPNGLFTLVMSRTPEGWRIVHDHTSSAN